MLIGIKRSEMIKIIGKELRKQSLNCDIDPDQLLAVLEASGMKPPLLRRTWESNFGTGNENMGYKWKEEE